MPDSTAWTSSGAPCSCTCLAVRIKVRMARTAADIIDIGRDLIAVKAALGHGHFLRWIEAEFNMTERMAQHFVRVADRFGEANAKDLSHLSAYALQALAAPSTPDEIVEEVTERASNGEAFTAADIKRMKDEWLFAECSKSVRAPCGIFASFAATMARWLSVKCLRFRFTQMRSALSAL